MWSNGLDLEVRLWISKDSNRTATTIKITEVEEAVTATAEVTAKEVAPGGSAAAAGAAAAPKSLVEE